MERYQETLVGMVREEGVEVLSREQMAFYVPAAYRFFEQVRVGEYEHNLLILARLIAGDLGKENPELDAGKIGRAARRLEMLRIEELEALSRCERAFQIYAESSDYDGYWLCICEQELIQSFKEVGRDYSALKAQEHLHELAARGLLTVGGRPSLVGGQFYYKNQAFNDVMAATELVSSAMATSP